MELLPGADWKILPSRCRKAGPPTCDTGLPTKLCSVPMFVPASTLNMSPSTISQEGGLARTHDHDVKQVHPVPIIDIFPY